MRHADKYSRLGDDTVPHLTPESPFIDWGLDGDGCDVCDNTIAHLRPESPFVNRGIDGAGSVGGGERVHCSWRSRSVCWLRGWSVVRDDD